LRDLTQSFENQDAKKIEKLVDFPESTEGLRQNPKKTWME
jgi:hypothetical protein